MSGVAAATFIPQVVQMSASDRMSNTVEGASASLILLLAGAYGVLPDTLDFKVGQFFAEPDIVVDPDPKNPDPQAMADAFALAVKRAGDSGKPVQIKFLPSQVGASLWRQYNIIFEKDSVAVQMNEIVKTSQIPIPGTAPATHRVGRAKLAYELKSRTDKIDWLNSFIRWLRQKIKGPDKPPGPVKPSTVDIFGGTYFEVAGEADGKIYFNWLPWHRTWSHSYVLGAMLTIPVFLIAYLCDLANWWLYGLVAFLGFFTHITEDMTGHIGGALFWPIHKPRCEGLELFKASDPRTNFSIDFAAIVLSVWNVDRFTTHLITMPGWLFLTLFLALPLAVYFYAVAIIKERIHESEKALIDDEVDGTGDAVVD